MQVELIVRDGQGRELRHALAPGRQVVLGRGEDADVLIDDESASRRHVALELTPQGLLVTDLGSKNGATLGDRALAPNHPTAASPGQLLTIGRHTIQLGAAPPRVREEFENLGELGSGAAGKVFRARHRATGQLVAIKSLLTRVQEDATTRERFLREARLRVDCPSVVQTYDVRIEEGQVYMIMELVEGRTADALLRSGALPLASALWVGEQVGRALAAAHQVGVVHRDVKPANVFVAADGSAKLGDWGIAKVLHATGSLTASGRGMGTLAYVAPEQAEDAKRVSPAADLYGLGATLYHMLAGKPPFNATNNPNIFTEIFEDDPPPLRKLRPDCPPGVARLVHRLLEKDPEDRPPSAAVVAQKLGELRAGLG